MRLVDFKHVEMTAWANKILKMSVRIFAHRPVQSLVTRPRIFSGSAGHDPGEGLPHTVCSHMHNAGGVHHLHFNQPVRLCIEFVQWIWKGPGPLS